MSRKTRKLIWSVPLGGGVSRRRRFGSCFMALEPNGACSAHDHRIAGRAR